MAQTITIIVVNALSKPVQGARLTIEPGGLSGTTDANGEYQFPIGAATKYDITASYDSNTVTVPYYVTKNGATRIVVNPVYVKQVQAERSSGSYGHLATNIGIGIAAALLVLVIWRFFRGRRNRE